MLKELNLEVVKDVICTHYLNDINFPRSCGSISMVLTTILQDSEISKKYNISYIRGHFRNDYNEEYCECEVGFYDGYDRNSNLDDFDCSNCDCDYMVAHSWIELECKETKKVTILDFTGIQFEEDFNDYHSEILETKYLLTREEIFDYLRKRSTFVVTEDNTNFTKYIPSEKIYPGEYVLNKTKHIIESKEQSDVTIILDEIGYKVSIK